MSTRKLLGMDRNREKRLSNKQTKARNQRKIFEWLKKHPESLIIAVSSGVEISRERVSLHLKELAEKGKVQKVGGLWSTASFIERKRKAEIESKKTYLKIMQIRDEDLRGHLLDFSRMRRHFLGLSYSEVSGRMVKEFSDVRLKKHGDKYVAVREGGFFPCFFERSVNVRIFSPFSIEKSNRTTKIKRTLFGFKREKGTDYKVFECAVDLMYTLFKAAEFQGHFEGNEEIVVEITLAPSEIIRQMVSLKEEFDDYRKKSWEIHGKLYPPESPEVRKQFPPIFSDLRSIESMKQFNT